MLLSLSSKTEQLYRIWILDTPLWPLLQIDRQKMSMTNLLSVNATPCEWLSDMCLTNLEDSHFNLAIFIEVLMFAYAFVGLAIVCDDYLVMSLEQVSL